MFDFPANPTTGEVYSEGDASYVWNGYAWVAGAGGVAAEFVLKAGDTMTGPLQLSADPTAALHAATKQYADNISTSITGSMVAKAGDTMEGLLTLAGAPSADLHAVPKTYADSKVARDGDTMTGALLLNGDPVAPMGAATKQYVDGLVASGQEFVGTFDATAGTIAWTTASGGSGNTLPAAAAGNNGWYLIAEVAGSTPPAGSPVGTYESGDWLLSDGVVWTHLALGGAAATTAAQVVVSPVIGGAGDVQVALTNLDSGKVSKLGDVMTGALTLPNTNPVEDNHATRKYYVDGQVGILNTLINNRVAKVGDTMTGHLNYAFSGSQQFSFAAIFNGNAAKQPAIAAFGSSLGIQEYGVAIKFNFDVDTGRFGIGTNAVPDDLIHVKGPSPNIKLQSVAAAQQSEIRFYENTVLAARVSWRGEQPLGSRGLEVRADGADRLDLVTTGAGKPINFWPSTSLMMVLDTTKLQINMATVSTSPLTGALTVAGGVGIGGALNTSGPISAVANVGSQNSFGLTIKNTSNQGAGAIYVLSDTNVSSQIGTRGSAMTPYANLTSNSFYMYTAHAAGLAFCVDAAGPMTWQTSGAVRMTLGSDGKLTLQSDPVAPLGVATKQYVDNLAGAGANVRFVNTYADLIALTSTPLPASLKQVQMLGYYWPGDQGSALWRITTVNPQHPEKLAWGSAWLELIPWPDGSINFCSLGYKVNEDGGNHDASLYLNRLQVYQNFVRLAAGSHGGWNMYLFRFPNGSLYFRTKPNKWYMHDSATAYGVVFLGSGYTVFYKDFCVDPNDVYEAIFMCGSYFTGNIFENISFVATTNSAPGGIGRGCFISMVTNMPAPGDTLGENTIRDCGFTSSNRTAWNVVTNGIYPTTGIKVRGLLIENCQSFGAYNGSMWFVCSGGIDLIKCGHAQSGGNSAKVEITGQPGNENSNTNIIGGAYSEIVANHVNNLNINTTCVNSFTTDYLTFSTIKVGNCYGNVVTTINTRYCQFEFGAVNGTANLLGPYCMGRGYVPAAPTVHANSVWNRPP